MAYIAEYKFPSSEAASAAYSKLSSSCCTQSGNYISIYSDCDDPAFAAQVCIANGEVAY